MVLSSELKLLVGPAWWVLLDIRQAAGRHLPAALPHIMDGCPVPPRGVGGGDYAPRNTGIGWEGGGQPRAQQQHYRQDHTPYSVLRGGGRTASNRLLTYP